MDVGDVIEDSIILPLLQRFLLIPLIITTAIYYVLYVLAAIVSFIIPFLSILLLGIIYGSYLIFKRIKYKKNRFILLIGATGLLVCLIMTVIPYSPTIRSIPWYIQSIFHLRLIINQSPMWLESQKGLFLLFPQQHSVTRLRTG